MGLLAGLVSGALVALALVQDRPLGAETQAWKETWADLARIADTTPGSPEHDRLWRELDGFQAREERSARKSHERAEVFRAQLLRAHLSRLAGVAVRPLADPGVRLEFLPGEAWLAVQVLGPGPTRMAALRSALSEREGDAPQAQLERGMEIAAEDARLLNLAWALDEARALHSRAPSARTACLVGRILRLQGEYDAAARILQDALSRARSSTDRAALFAERGRALESMAPLAPAIGRAADADVLEEFGAAFASGSEEAGLELAFRALTGREPARARALFRSILEGSPSLPGARRGYGLALLDSAGPSPGTQPAASFPLEKP